MLPLALTLSLTACAPRDEREDENAQYSAKPVIYLYPEEEQDEVCDAKPVAYLYPQTETEITVQLDYDGELTCTYPAYADGWTVSARPDGTLTDKTARPTGIYTGKAYRKRNMISHPASACREAARRSFWRTRWPGSA